MMAFVGALTVLSVGFMQHVYFLQASWSIHVNSPLVLSSLTDPKSALFPLFPCLEFSQSFTSPRWRNISDALPRKQTGELCYDRRGARHGIMTVTPSWNRSLTTERFVGPFVCPAPLFGCKPPGGSTAVFFMEGPEDQEASASALPICFHSTAVCGDYTRCSTAALARRMSLLTQILMQIVPETSAVYIVVGGQMVGLATCLVGLVVLVLRGPDRWAGAAHRRILDHDDDVTPWDRAIVAIATVLGIVAMLSVTLYAREVPRFEGSSRCFGAGPAAQAADRLVDATHQAFLALFLSSLVSFSLFLLHKGEATNSQAGTLFITICFVMGFLLQEFMYDVLLKGLASYFNRGKLEFLF